MLAYRFMRVALLACVLLGLTLPLLGNTAVFKRLSSSGDALAHSSLAGVAIGLAAGLSPLWIPILCCIVSFFLIEFLRKKFNKYAEMGVAVVLSAAVGIAGILSSYSSASNFDAYLFGSLLLISDTELYCMIALAVVVVAFSLLFFRQSFASIYSLDEAKVSKIKTGWLTFGQDLLLSIAVAIGAKIVGSLVVSSLLVLPAAIALQFKKGYRFTVIASLIASLISMIGGLVLAYYCDYKPGATIVCFAIAILILVMAIKGIVLLFRHLRYKKAA